MEVPFNGAIQKNKYSSFLSKFCYKTGKLKSYHTCKICYSINVILFFSVRMERARGIINSKALILRAPESLMSFVFETIEVYFVSRRLVTENYIKPIDSVRFNYLLKGFRCRLI